MCSTTVYRSSGEMYLDALRKSIRENATEQDKLNLLKAAQHFHEQLLLDISSLSDLLAVLDEDSLPINARAGLGSVINELSMLAFDCYDVMRKHSL